MGRIKMKYPMRLRGGGDTYGQEACVYKMWADEKFMIWKGRAFSKSVSQSSETIERSLRVPIKPGNPFEKFTNFIQERRCMFVEVEPISYPQNALELLKLEHTLLQQEKDNPRCINTIFEAYIPEWIPTGHRESFEEWKQSLTSKKQ